MDNELELNKQYGKLVEYPLPGSTINYRKKPYVQGENYHKTTFHDLIYLNSQELMPNIELGLYQRKTTAEIIDWTEKTKTYMNMLHIHFQKVCDEKIETIKNIKRRDEQQEKFVAEDVSRLPEDMQIEIISYLPSETRLILLQERRPNIQEEMKKWKVHQLKTFYKEVVIPNYINKINEDWSNKCLTTTTFMGISMSTKDTFINEIFRLIGVLSSAVPRILSKYYRYKKQAMTLMMSIIYVHKKLVKPIVVKPVVVTKNKETKTKITKSASTKEPVLKNTITSA